MKTPTQLAQEQLDAYNERNLARFAACYSADVKAYRLPNPTPILEGIEALSNHYASKRFNLPALHAKLVSRMAFGNKVIDHEIVTGVGDSPMEVAAIYQAKDGVITHIWFVDAA
jgi:hypothetical protein